jgi:sensor histidine kinase regulating citrate/malate metabolism
VFSLNDIKNLETNLLGKHNLYNLARGLTVLKEISYEITEELRKIIKNLNISKMRIEKIEVENIIFINDDDLIIEYIDDGYGLHESIINPSDIFEIGITTTSGSGLGLHHIKESLHRMKKSTIEVNKMDKGIKFIIRLKI